MITIQKDNIGPAVSYWQELLGFITCDGVFTEDLYTITTVFQNDFGLVPDGIVGPLTWEKGRNMGSVAKVRGIEKLSKSDLIALQKVANRLGIPQVDYLATPISFETAGSFSPSKKNAAGSGATGLIQFMPSTAKNLGTTTEALAKMTFQQQLVYVEKYFQPWKGKLKTLEDVYLAIFYPAYINKKPSDVIATEGSAVYTQNMGFDPNRTGQITRGDVTSTITSYYNQFKNLPRITIPLITTGSLIAYSLVGVGLYRYFQKDT
jgi:peptidoglycan hydrolase-like protein with peptidoglycan-binding domain